MIKILVLLALPILLAAPAIAEPHLSVCQLVRNGAKLSGQRIRLDAIYVTDLLEHDALIDRQCPHNKLRADWSSSKGAARDASLSAFDKAVFSRPPDYKQLTRFSVDVTGQFVWQPKEEPPGMLIFQKMWSFKRLH